jgi:hypothetical protein
VNADKYRFGEGGVDRYYAVPRVGAPFVGTSKGRLAACAKRLRYDFSAKFARITQIALAVPPTLTLVEATRHCLDLTYFMRTAPRD